MKNDKVVQIRLPASIIYEIKSNDRNVSSYVRRKVMAFLNSKNSIEPLKIEHAKTIKCDIYFSEMVYKVLCERFVGRGQVSRAVQAIIVNGVKECA